MDSLEITTWQRQPQGPTARGQKSLLKGDGFAIRQGGGFPRQIDPLNGDPQFEGDALFLKVGGWVEEEIVPRLFPPEEILRQGRAVVRNVRLLAD